VTLGTPHKAALSARNALHCIPFLLRYDAVILLMSDFTMQWRQSTKLHNIAGNKFSSLFALFSDKNNSDGAVSVHETYVLGQSSHKTFNTNHSGLIFNKQISEYILDII
jgi:hypothetical protein